MLYINVQREGLRLIKEALRNWKKVYQPSFVTHRTKKPIPSQTQIAFHDDIQLTWVLDKIKLIELVAALNELNAFGGDVSRKQLWPIFSHWFNIDLPGPEQALSQMKHRKGEQVIFIEQMKAALIQAFEKGL